MNRIFKTRLISLALALTPALLALSIPSFAGERSEGSGVRGGGEIVDYQGSPELRDLVDSTTCDWISGDQMVTKVPTVESILAKLSELDWYFAFELEREIRSLDYCLTSHLIKINTQDRDALTTTYLQDTSQVAIRLNHDVYIDQVLMASLTAQSQGYLLIHETMHSYLRMKEPQRNQKLRSMVKSIQKAVNGSISNVKDLHFQMTKNAIQFPQTGPELSAYSEQIKIALGDQAYRRNLILSSAFLKPLFNLLPQALIENLAPWDQKEYAVKAISNLAPLMEPFCQERDYEVLKKVLQAKDISGFSTALVCMSVEGIEDDLEFRKFLLTTVDFPEIFKQFFIQLLKKNVSLNDYRIVADAELARLSREKNRIPNTPVMRLFAPTPDTWNRLDREMTGFFEAITLLIREGQWSVIETEIQKSALFYQAFETVSLMGQIVVMPGTISREKTHALEALTELTNGFWKTALAVLSAKLTPDALERLREGIDFRRLGVSSKQVDGE